MNDKKMINHQSKQNLYSLVIG